ncbi:MAG: JAB domain-containing protein [Deltaproteobacteria bacterium]|nr:JAB domain-containing protein [Deltaproteobacteria bacterium]
MTASPHKGAGHRKRLRDKFMASGLSGFADYEVVELLLTLATPQRDCKDSAKAALERFSTLKGVLEAQVKELCEIDGIGPKNAFGIKLVLAVSARYLKQRLEKTDPLANSASLFEYLYHTMSGSGRESFRVLFLDAKNRVIATDTLFYGTLTASPVYPREVVSAALRHGAAALIFAHNHPSGDPAPSPDDFAITRRLIFACMTMGVTVHEHLVIGDRQYYSFADHGHIRQMCAEFEQGWRRLETAHEDG